MKADSVTVDRIRKRYPKSLELQGAMQEAMLNALIKMGDSVTQLSLFSDEPYGKDKSVLSLTGRAAD